jgi:hypothetical protein
MGLEHSAAFAHPQCQTPQRLMLVLSKCRGKGGFAVKPPFLLSTLYGRAVSPARLPLATA